ncbi:MotA/TolQ/ExbB proton channel family protein [bacterium]|nr:MotA/TolQ/ExbB proton channel family protein [bacterium]
MRFIGILGVLIGIFLIGGAIYIGINDIEFLTIPAAWGIFVNIPAMMIVLGGALAATMVAFQSNTLQVVFRSLWVVASRRPPDFEGQRRAIVILASRATQGNVEIEKMVRSARNPFLRDGIQMLADNYSLEEIAEILGQRIEFRMRKEQADAEVIRTIGRFCPAFGMAGTIIGLINMLANLSLEGDATATIGSDMAVALVTTFYGLILAYLLFIPLAVKLEKRTEEEIQLMQMIIDSIRMIKEQWHPRKVEDYLNSYLPPAKRTKLRRLPVR